MAESFDDVIKNQNWLKMALLEILIFTFVKIWITSEPENFLKFVYHLRLAKIISFNIFWFLKL